MGTYQIILYTICFLIIINGLRVWFNLTIQYTQFNYKHYNCCKCPTSEATDHERKIQRPHASCGNWTLTRIGSDLNFNYNSCPKDSIMLDPIKLNAKPKHDNCPRVFIVGVRKVGTTSLYQYLSRHPDFEGIRLDKGPSAGETFYFSARYETYPWEYYISHFPTNKMSGDSSVGNLINCKVPGRLYKSCGKASKVIMLLRNPIERYQSNFRMRVRRSTGNTNSFSKISTLVRAEVHRLYQSLLQRGANMNDLASSVNMLLCLYQSAKNCIYEGMYYVHLHNWMCNFPPENILILNTEEFRNRSKCIFSQVLNFVGLRPLDDGILNTITEMKYNYGGEVEDEPDYRLLSSSDKKTLQTIYKPLNDKLFNLLQWHDVSWGH